ncbi:MAG: dihydrofolate reductase family protein [Actinobacteria bacterium]|nr:dihydrofolate reductase family protein [Actinomycetota bacterium]MCA1722572.1 dihydrofolate reductase family protein [Actinomycetota bacterium]
MRQLLPTYDAQPDLLQLYGTDGPYVRGGFVLSTDGVAVVDGGSRALSGPADRAVFRTLRAVCDVILVGAATTRAEDYGTIRLPAGGAAWRASRGLPPLPRVAVMTASGDVDERVFRGERPLVLQPPGSRPDPRADVLTVRDVPDALDQLAARGLRRVLCEGGPTLLSALVAAGRLDELCLTSAPLLAGRGPGLLADELDRPIGLQLRILLEEDGVLLGGYEVIR